MPTLLSSPPPLALLPRQAHTYMFLNGQPFANSHPRSHFTVMMLSGAVILLAQVHIPSPIKKSHCHKPNHVYPSPLAYSADQRGPHTAPHATATSSHTYSITYSSTQCHTQSHHHIHSTTPPQSHCPLCLPLQTGTTHHPRGYPIREILTSLHLQLYGTMDPLLPVVVPDLHHKAAVEAAVRRG